MQYTAHAEKQLVDRRISKAEAESVAANPDRGQFNSPARDIIENYGHAADGRPINVVTNRAKTVVITVIEQ